MRRLLSILACLASLSVPIVAHHAFGGEFDPNRPLLLKGKVTEQPSGKPVAGAKLFLPRLTRAEPCCSRARSPKWSG